MWTEDEEKKWKELTNKREKNKEEVGKQHTIEMLKKMISSLEKGEDMPVEICIDYIRGEKFYADPGLPPVIGKKITLIYR